MWPLWRGIPGGRRSPAGFYQVIQQEELGDRQRLAALAAIEFAQETGHFHARAEPVPDGLLEQLAVLAGRVAVDVQRVDRPAVLVARQLQVHRLAATGEDRAQVGVADGGA